MIRLQGALAEAVVHYVTFGATPKTGQKTSPPWRIDLFVSEALSLYPGLGSGTIEKYSAADATPKTTQETRRWELFVSTPLKFPVSLASSIFQSVNTIRGTDLSSMQYISPYWSNLIKDVHNLLHFYLRAIRNQVNILCDDFNFGWDNQIFNR